MEQIVGLGGREDLHFYRIVLNGFGDLGRDISQHEELVESRGIIEMGPRDWPSTAGGKPVLLRPPGGWDRFRPITLDPFEPLYR